MQRTNETIFALATSAVAKVDRFGHRGLTLLSLEEIEALVLALVILTDHVQQEKPL